MSIRSSNDLQVSVLTHSRRQRCAKRTKQSHVLKTPHFPDIRSEEA
ncbi:hypothetical protein [Microcoleus sp. S28C3]